MTRAELIAKRDALLAQRASGTRRYRDQNGEEVEYRTDAEMAAAIRALDAEIRAAGSPPPHTFTFATSKGLS